MPGGSKTPLQRGLPVPAVALTTAAWCPCPEWLLQDQGSGATCVARVGGNSGAPPKLAPYSATPNYAVSWMNIFCVWT